MPTIQSGYDLFETDGDAYFTLPHGFSVPADFFQKGSAPFSGIIRFTGSPIRKFEDPRTGKEHKIGSTDTIVLRKKDVTFANVPGSGTTEIELVMLSLKSVSPIQVRTAHGVQKWDVTVSISSAKPSAGTMTIRQTSESGGTFDSELTIYPVFHFERHSDGETKTFDTGAAKIPQERVDLVSRINNLQAADVPWTTSHPAGTLAATALTGNFAVARIAHHSHNVVATTVLA